jgi:hypothetical protein
MRNRHVTCDRCQGKCMITANLDTGKVDLKQSYMPKQCTTPTRCAEGMSKGIFDRLFGEQSKKPMELKA